MNERKLIVLENQIGEMVERLGQYEAILQGETVAFNHKCGLCAMAQDELGHRDCGVCLAGKGGGWAQCASVGATIRNGLSVHKPFASYSAPSTYAVYDWYRELIKRANKRLSECGSKWRIQGKTKKALGL